MYTQFFYHLINVGWPDLRFYAPPTHKPRPTPNQPHTPLSIFHTPHQRFGNDLRDYFCQLDSWEEHEPSHGARKGHPKLKEAIQELRRVDFSGAQVQI